MSAIGMVDFIKLIGTTLRDSTLAGVVLWERSEIRSRVVRVAGVVGVAGVAALL
jgi:hypothetical protein